MKITKPMVVKALKEAVNEKGADYRYQDDHSSYWGGYYIEPDKTPSCIVGHVLVSLGVEPDILLDRNVAPITSLDEWLDQRGVTITDPALSVLSSVQQRQDNGITWGNAVSEALEFYS